jgi:hypothetical protein
LSGHAITSGHQKKSGKKEKMALLQMREASAIKTGLNPVARWEGDHLGCNPCGKLAGRELCHRVACPEVLLSLLPN